jgi:hypothetical protein
MGDLLHNLAWARLWEAAGVGSQRLNQGLVWREPGLSA